MKPKFITFDCYGTLTRFQMSALTRELMSGVVDAADMGTFLDDFEAYRMDEVLGPYKPYAEVITDAFRRACGRWRATFRRRDAEAIVEAVPSWGPHADVPEGLARIAERYPLVILSNAADDQIRHNVAKFGVPFHAVYTAEQARAYKPSLRCFEYMLDGLGCGVDDIVHVSSSMRYDIIPAFDLRIRNKVYVNRGYEPSTPFYEYVEIPDIAHLPDLLEP